MRRFLRTTISMAAAALALGTVACGGDRDEVAEERGGTVTPAPAQAPAPGAAAFRVADVTLGRAVHGDTAVVEDMDDFATTDTIHAIVRHEGVADNTTLTARWTFQDGQVVDERSETVSASGTAPGYTHFMISKPTAWPAGEYVLHILVNGAEVESEEFEIK